MLPKNVTVLFDGAFCTIENESFLGYVEQIYDVGIMVLVILPIDEHIIVYGQYSWALGYNVIHSHLKDILAHFESKWYMKNSVHAEVCVECCEEWSFLCQMHSKESLIVFHLGQFGCSCEYVGYLLKGWSIVVLMDDGFVQVLWVKAYPQPAISLLGVCERADPWCGLSLFGDDSLMHHLSQLFFISSLYSMGTFHLPCWTGRTEGSVLMLYSPNMSPMQSKQLGNNTEDPWYCWWM